jgi:hypothetical protein
MLDEEKRELTERRLEHESGEAWALDTKYANEWGTRYFWGTRQTTVECQKSLYRDRGQLKSAWKF